MFEEVSCREDTLHRTLISYSSVDGNTIMQGRLPSEFPRSQREAGGAWEVVTYKSHVRWKATASLPGFTAGTSLPPYCLTCPAA